MSPCLVRRIASSSGMIVSLWSSFIPILYALPEGEKSRFTNYTIISPRNNISTVWSEKDTISWEAKITRLCVLSIMVIPSNFPFTKQDTLHDIQVDVDDSGGNFIRRPGRYPCKRIYIIHFLRPHYADPYLI